MSVSAKPSPPPKGQFLVSQTEDGQLKIDVRLEAETAWLTQAHMAELFQTTVPNVSMHLRNVFSEGELQADSVIKEFLTTAADGKNYTTKYYNLDAIISIGYRVKSAVATRFRIWATQKLREFIVKSFVLDDERLKNPDQPFDYFDELLRRIQDIRTSERRFYQKITDIYSTSIDYDPTQPVRIAHPPRALLDRFSAIVAPSFRMIQKLHLQIQNLRRTRDLLLPRLLSGQLALASLSAPTARRHISLGQRPRLKARPIPSPMPHSSFHHEPCRTDESRRWRSWIVCGHFPGALPQAGMNWAFGPQFRLASILGATPQAGIDRAFGPKSMPCRNL